MTVYGHSWWPTLSSEIQLKDSTPIKLKSSLVKVINNGFSYSTWYLDADSYNHALNPDFCFSFYYSTIQFKLNFLNFSISWNNSGNKQEKTWDRVRNNQIKARLLVADICRLLGLYSFDSEWLALGRQHNWSCVIGICWTTSHDFVIRRHHRRWAN